MDVLKGERVIGGSNCPKKCCLSEKFTKAVVTNILVNISIRASSHLSREEPLHWKEESNPSSFSLPEL